MSVRQTNRVSGLFLPWSGPVEGAGPAHQQLAALVRGEINAGRLRPGDRMPPSRALAEELGVSRWVVTEAYDQLTAEGYLSARVGSGTVVTGGAGGTAPAVPTAPAPRSAPTAAVSPDRTRAPAAPRVVHDLWPALPDLGSFPRTLWRAALGRALAAVSDAELGNPDPAGAPGLRATMADYLRRVRALAADGDRVLVTQGVGSAVAELCRHLRAGGAERVAVEDPSWPRLREIARRQGLDIVPVAVDASGLVVTDLVRADRRRRIDAVFTMPTHQFPTGVPLSADRRLALLEWAAARGRWLIEDDYDAEFRYDRHPIGAMASLGPDHVVYLGSVSKTLSPSLHLGWMVAPPRLRRALLADRVGTALSPTVDQLALADLVTSGGYDRHLRRMRRHYRRRREALLDALLESTPGAPAPSMDAGLHVLWRLPAGTDEDGAVRRCATAGLSVLGLARCRIRSGQPGLVLGCANLAPRQAASVARTLAGVLAAQTGGSRLRTQAHCCSSGGRSSSSSII